MESAPQPTQSVPSRTARITAAMVASKAGVSTATVSLVANNKTAGRVSEDNVAKVRAAIDELGYVVDGVASSLSKGTSGLVIMVAPDISNPFFAKVIAGVRSALAADYQLLLSVTDSGEFPQAADVRRLLALRPAGILVDAPSADFLRTLAPAIPMVLLDAPGTEGLAPAVNLDVANGARQLAEHLATLGHRKIAYLDSVTGTQTFDVRREALFDFAHSLGMEIPAAGHVRCSIDVATAAGTIASHWVDWQQAGITAVVCSTDTHAHGVLQEARVLGVGVPDQLAVAGFDDLPFSASSNPPLTSVHLPATELGERAGAQLLKVLANEPLASQTVTLPSALVVRGSTAAKTQSAVPPGTRVELPRSKA